MTNIFLGQGHGHERRKRKHSSSNKSSKPQAVTPNLHTSNSNVHLQQHSSPPPAMPVQMPVRHQTGYPPHGAGSHSTTQHPVYGSVPLYPSHHHQQQTYASPGPQPVYNQSTVTFAPSPPHSKEKRGPFDSYFDKVDRLAAKSCADLSHQLASGAGKSTTNLVSKTSQYFDQSTHLVSKKSTQALNHGAALCDIISSKLDAVITSIDGELFSGKEQDLRIQEHSYQYPSTSTLPAASSKGILPHAVYGAIENSDKGSNHFSKVWLYGNSRLPPHLPPFKVYMPTYPLLCLAATYSERVYTPPAPKTSEHESHVPSDWRSGTKAMVLKTVPIDDMNTIVFAIRGSATFMDWAVNYRSDPVSPSGFLDDATNLCHAGFLYVARKMVQNVAERLRALLQENPSRSHASLLITGHSAGGAVASLLYAHMMSTTVDSELNYLTDFFKRVHCVTFGAPPVTLHPLTKSNDKRHRKSLFYSFINEGDPVPRADKQMVRSLLKLYASPAPSLSGNNTCTSSAMASLSKLNLSSTNTSSTTFQTNGSSRSSRPSKPSKQSSSLASMMSAQPLWNIPPSTLSTAGRLVVLRKRPNGRDEDDVEAVTVDDSTLRKVVYGDPLKHMMTIYKQRVDLLAVRAVTAGGY